VNILVVRPDGIGDEILALPVATAIRALLPQARILFLSSAYAAPVLEHHPDVDEVLCVDGRESFRDLVRLFRTKIDAAVFLKPFRRLMAAAWLARVPVRVGTGYRWYSWLLTRRIYEHRSDFAQHESVYNVGLLRGLDLVPGVATRPRLIVTKQERDWAKTYLGPTRVSRVVVHPGGFSSRTWKAGHFRDLIHELARLGCEVLLTGSTAESERFRNETGGTEWPENVRDLMGALSLRELMAVIAESDVLVSMSSGPMHMAAALGIPTVSLFDPRRSQSPTRWESLGGGTVLMPDVPTCERCIYEACPYWDCLDRITVPAVIRQVQQVLASTYTVDASVAVARV
jgi:ADP-heptose:LPS heptosyltransferase